MGYEKAVLPNDQGTRVDGEGKPLEAEVDPMICYSREFGFYVELCEINEDAAAFAAYGGNATDWACIRLASDDIRHAHQPDGSCVRLVVLETSKGASDVRARMGRAFVSGQDFVRA